MIDLPTQIAESTLKIMGVELTVAVLDNGQRLIVGDGLQRLFEAMADGAPLSSDDAMKLAKIVR
jgi:hypothetical protein